ncbi:Tcp11 domain-containing protein [Cephalotus follicularis]|uniref:Tcp11 domain-containing protein n=1 Tax=Cephalotus follicularis TaxID=3775 RepID=A0A1Q3AZJ6_CEPFO|nr:Tcp11 domain-containing protein [Cephalotus follicularis]
MMETPERAIVMEFPASETASYRRVPRRIKKRLLVDCDKTPFTVEQIEAKLRLADLRRQQFYENLSSKARPKPRSPSHSSSNEEDLGQRLEAKLQAAEQKRLNILAQAQMRLARLDELRRAAKTGVKLRFEKERQNLGTKVESRVQKAEANRMLILKAYSQRRATLKERSSQSLVRRMTRESKYKERVHAAINQRRADAERKRLGLLELEKKRARARFLLVRRIAKSVSHQREVERRRMRDQLEDRLQRAKQQRAEYLRQRGRQHNSVRVSLIRMNKQADILSRKLARCWRRFLRLKKTTLSLTKAYYALNINENSVQSMPFELLAILIESTATLQTVKAILDRFESRLKVFKAVSASNHPYSLDNIDHLLKRVATPKRRTTPRTPMRSRETKKVASIREAARSAVKLSRYPVRIFLCAYMILGHPDAVLSCQGESEIALAMSARDFVREFELLIKIILDGPVQSSDEDNDDPTLSKRWTFRSQLVAFDKAWCSYLNCFVVWKIKDAQLLEEDLVRAACQLELSMIKKCKLTLEGDKAVLTHDLKAIQKQVTEDQKLLREKVQHLSGDAGIERMECALSETRSKYFQAKENGIPVGSPTTHFLSPITPSSPAGPSSVATSVNGSNMVEGIERPSRVVRSLFRENDASSGKGFVSSGPNSSSASESGLFLGKQQVTENELIVNEFIHEQRRTFVDSFSVTDEDQNSVTGKMRKTMEKAFWDGIMESMKQNEPDYDRIVQLMKEVRDEICEMAPQSWKEGIIEAIDPEILSQVLKSGSLDIDYLGKILEFALVTLQKLSAPANDDELETTHQRLLKELAEICQTGDDSNLSHVFAMVKGLRFVLEQIQTLKQEISKARIRMMEPLLKGAAGLDYLRKAFAEHYGSPSDACTSLPLTAQWLSSLSNFTSHDWEEYTNSLSALMGHESSSQGFLPSATLRTGGSLLVKTTGSGLISPFNSASTNTKGTQQPECKGEKVDLLVRLGLLKLVSGVSGLTQEVLPETLVLNFSRLRAVQGQIQKIIVISTSILVFRQLLLTERVVTSPSDVESIISECTKQVMELLEHTEEAGLEEIVEIISGFPTIADEVVDAEKLQPRKLVLARMLAKSLQAGDPVFERVSRAVYLAAKRIVLGGSGPQGRKLAEMALRPIGAAVLTERVVEAAETLVVAATVSVSVHGPWYISLTGNL